MMIYRKLEEAIFLKRPNRFIAHIKIEETEEICHVKNTGRLGELLIPGVKVLVEPANDKKRKTKFSLICVQKNGRWVNIDSQVPNKVAEEWIKEGNWIKGVSYLKREKVYGNSRFDLYAETENEKWFIEVKGVTLNKDGVAMFPDAPTERGKKHVEELISCLEEGYKAAILFVVQMKGVKVFSPFEERQPAFAQALREAKEAGVEICAVDCVVDENSIFIDSFLPVQL